jgi:DoxX-like family
MQRNIAYWAATGLVTIVPLLAAFSYLTTSPAAVENFRHVGYPQQLRVLLGIAKLAGAIVLAPAAAADLEGMGLRGLHLHVDRGISRALSGR